MNHPVAWTREGQFELYYGNDPGVGQFTLSGTQAGKFHEPVHLGFSPALDPGLEFTDIMARLKAMRKEDDSHYTQREYQRLSAMIRLGSADRGGYVHDVEEGKRLIEVARARPVLEEPIDVMIRNAGFEFRHFLKEAVIKCYAKKIRYGHMLLSRGVDHLHLTFERTTAHSWTNVFRYSLYNHTDKSGLWPIIWPDYMDSMEIGTLLALDTARQFEENGHNRKRAYKPR